MMCGFMTERVYAQRYHLCCWSKRQTDNHMDESEETPLAIEYYVSSVNLPVAELKKGILLRLVDSCFLFAIDHGGTKEKKKGTN